MLSTSVMSVVVAVLLIASALSISAQNDNPTFGDCITPNDEPGLCVLLNNCKFLYEILKQKPLSATNAQFLRRSQCGSRNRDILVCCSNKHLSGPSQGGLLPEPGTCGKMLSDRIHGGTVANINEFPWMAVILYKKGLEVKHFCGGSLINDRYVLTAAHCLTSTARDWKLFSVRLGEWDLSTNPDCDTDTRGNRNCAEPHEEILIETPTAHPSFANGSSNLLNDIALLRLSRSVKYTHFIQPICLPIGDSLKDISLDGVAMDIAGWGFTERGTKSDLKLKAVVYGVPEENCRQVYGSSRYKIEVDNSQICAGGEKGVDSCGGDSGGALVASDTSNKSRAYYYIAGIISFGRRCGLEGWPAIHTKVSNYVDWIQENIQP